jgi:glycine oxidase
VTRTSDIVVVGAGIAGCAAAYELTRRGASVTVMDDRAPGMGATQASAGVLAPYIEAREAGPLVDLAARSLNLFDQFVERVTSDRGGDIRYRRNGTLDVATSAAGMERLRQAAAELRRRGVPAALLDADGVKAEEAQVTSEVVGGLSIPVHGYVGAAELTRALYDAARQRGALFAAGRVTRISPAGTDLVVETATTRLTASRVVLAAGAWAGTIALEGVRDPVPVRPIRGQLLEFAWTGATPRRVTWGEDCYVVPWTDGTVLVGATVEDVGFDEHTTPDGIQRLTNAVSSLLPRAATSALRAARAGLRPATPDHLPIIGNSDALPGLVYATGHYRNGVLLSPLTADLVADLVLDGGTDAMLTLTRPRRFGAL